MRSKIIVLKDKMGGKILNTNHMNRSIMKWYTVYDVPYMYLCANHDNVWTKILYRNVIISARMIWSIMEIVLQSLSVL